MRESPVDVGELTALPVYEVLQNGSHVGPCSSQLLECLVIYFKITYTLCIVQHLKRLHYIAKVTTENP